jgi:hypothetical protein
MVSNKTKEFVTALTGDGDEVLVVIISTILGIESSLPNFVPQSLHNGLVNSISSLLKTNDDNRVPV